MTPAIYAQHLAYTATINPGLYTRPLLKAAERRPGLNPVAWPLLAGSGHKADAAIVCAPSACIATWNELARRGRG